MVGIISGSGILTGIAIDASNRLVPLSYALTVRKLLFRVGAHEGLESGSKTGIKGGYVVAVGRNHLGKDADVVSIIANSSGNDHYSFG